MKNEIIFYSSKSGYCQIQHWIRNLETENKRRVYERLERVKVGNFGDYKILGEGVSELRFHFDHGYRIYFGRDGINIVILLCAGAKDTQQKDIRKAKILLEEYQND